MAMLTSSVFNLGREELPKRRPVRWDPWGKVSALGLMAGVGSLGPVCCGGDLTPEKLPLSSTPAYNMPGLKHKQIRKSRARVLFRDGLCSQSWVYILLTL